MRDDVDALLGRFLDGLRAAVPLLALWAHGSLALGDFQPGRSDLDLIAVVPEPLTTRQRARLKALHERLDAREPGAEKLHCSYIPLPSVGESGAEHLTWAHRGLLTRPVTPVSRRELHLGRLTLYGHGPDALLPPVDDAELTAFIRADLRDYWLPATTHPVRWLQDIWVDLGMLTLARASVTLRDGRLITKAEALDVLSTLGAPADIVAGIRARRYDASPVFPAHRRPLRAHRARTYLHHAIPRALATG